MSAVADARCNKQRSGVVSQVLVITWPQRTALALRVEFFSKSWKVGSSRNVHTPTTRIDQQVGHANLWTRVSTFTWRARDRFPQTISPHWGALGTRKCLRALCDTRASVGDQSWHRVEVVDNPSFLAAAVPRTRRVTARLVVNQAIRDGRDWSLSPPPTFLRSLGMALLSMPRTGKHASLGDVFVKLSQAV